MKLHKHICACVLVAFAASPLAAQKTETDYQPIGPPPGLLSPGVETSYNPKGTISESDYALLSVRRDDPEFTGFLLGLQQAAMKGGGDPLNVAPLSEENLSEQHSALRAEGAEFFLVDAPDPAAAQQFFRNVEFLEIKAVLISQDIIPGKRPPMVIYSPLYTAERVGEEAIRLIGNEDKVVAYAPPSIEDEKKREAMLKMFRKPFQTVAPNITLRSLNEEGGEKADVVVALTPEDSAELLKRGRDAFSGAKMVLTGESAEIRDAFDEGKFDVRVRPNYGLLLGFAKREVQKQSEIPPVALPTADTYRPKPKETPETEKE